MQRRRCVAPDNATCWFAALQRTLVRCVLPGQVDNEGTMRRLGGWRAAVDMVSNAVPPRFSNDHAISPLLLQLASAAQKAQSLQFRGVVSASLPPLPLSPPPKIATTGDAVSTPSRSPMSPTAVELPHAPSPNLPPHMRRPVVVYVKPYA